jgi:dihydroflavonol-4-reductase
MKKSPTKILVTGATGMLGAHLLWHLLQKGYTVRAIKRSSSAYGQVKLIFSSYGDSLDNYKEQFEWVEGDVVDHESIDKAIVGIDIVYHCAAIVSLSKKTKRILDINIRGTQNIVYASLKEKVQKICFVSSIASLGSANDGELIDENTLWNPNETHSLYSESKYMSEEVVWNAIKKGLNAVIVNPGVILGLADELNNSMKIFSLVKKGLPVYTTGANGYVSVQDVCRAMIQLTESDIKSERFVLVSENLTHKKVLHMVAKALHKRPPFIKGTWLLLMPIAGMFELFAKIFKTKAPLDRGTVRVILDRSYYSSEKVKKAIGFEFTPIEQCVEEVCGFMKKK